MGSRFSFLLAAPLLLATPALAQQENSAEPVFNLPRDKPQTDTDKQGPELDVFRGTPTTVTPPPIVLPTLQVPQPVAPPATTPAPQPAPQQPQRRAAPAAPPRTLQSTPFPQSQTPPAAAAPAEPAAPAVDNQTLPPTENATAPAAVEPAAVEPAPLAPAEGPAFPWPWIAAAAAAAALIGGFLWLRRRKPAEVEEQAYERAAEPAPAPQPKARPAPVPPARKPEPAPVATDRPWLDLAMEVQAARLTLMGATIGYTLKVHNRGLRPAEDILIRGLIANADARQQALFEQFFAGAVGLPIHSAVAIAPGETQSLRGELRLDAQQIAAIPMGQRALLIPLIAFDAQYRWTNEAGETQGAGRTGRAFIIGEEQTPPVERLSPFRLDLGPRQYRTPGSRATALSLAS
ncbi:hypothetical protein [Sphingobium sp.]|uniref:hypothetical protein n=1 Tax=Sphingobium sp. TaxID=1912891 RepID=UPI0035C66487